MDIENIKLFLKVAETLNISQAAAACSLTPSKASARISKLESELGIDLFHRSTRSVSLSSEGQRFYPFAQEIAKQDILARNALTSVTSLAEIGGSLRFACSSTFANLYIIPLLGEFLDLYPNIDLQLYLSDRSLNIIESGIDLALRNIRITDSRLKARKLADDRRFLCAAPNYLERFGVPQTPDDLAHHHMITFKETRSRRLILPGQDGAFAFPPTNMRQRIVCDDGLAMRLATLAGVGVSMNSQWSVAQDLKEGKLERVLPEYEIDDQTALWLVYPSANSISDKVRIFIDFLVEKLGENPPWEEAS